MLPPLTRLAACVLAPFAFGYFLSYVFRTINAVIAGPLAGEFDLGPADLGFLTSIYFLMMAVVQWPLGILLDRYGPRRVQSACYVVTAAGAAAFATAESLMALLAARALIGIGVATSLMAGLKAVIVWFPPERIGFANGVLVTIGALGAVTATAPAEFVIDALGWRGLFFGLAALTFAAAALIFAAVPERTTAASRAQAGSTITLRDIYRDPRLWRLAPMSAACVGCAWAIQGLWAAPWLSDVEGLDRVDIVRHLLVMALALSFGAIMLGTLSDRLRRRGMATAMAFMLAQAAIVLRWPVPPYFSWSIVGVAGAATVLSFAILPGYFPKEASGRANSALNLLHLSAAFAVQWLVGVVVGQWPEHDGRPPATAYQTAFLLLLALQVLACAWFALAPLLGKSITSPKRAPPVFQPYRAPNAISPYRQAHLVWLSHVSMAQHQARSWRAAALAAMAVAAVLTSLAVPSHALVER
jgi:predicted MFS family arabinose efflux permease